MNRKTVFICAPYAGEISLNINRAMAVSHKLWESGYMPLCPHISASFFCEDTEREKALDYCLQLLTMSDYIYIIPGTISAGMSGEIRLAKALNKTQLILELNGRI